MKTIMSIEEYKLYKQGQLSIMDLKMKNIKGSGIYNWTLNHKELLANVAMFGIIVTSNMAIKGATTNDVMLNLYKIIAKEIIQEDPGKWLIAFFKDLQADTIRCIIPHV